MVFTARQVTILLQPQQSKERSHRSTSIMSFLNDPAFAMSYAINSCNHAFSTDEDEDDGTMMPWDDDGWVARTKSGRQLSPNQIRGELNRYIDANSLTKSKVMKEMDVTGPSFYKFMNVSKCRGRRLNSTTVVCSY